MKTISKLEMLCVAAYCACAFMLPEDKVPKNCWQSLTAKEKRIFLMGYRTGTGPASEMAQRMPEVPAGFLVLSESHFDGVIKLVDGFYVDARNKDVRVKGAIEIALMKMQKRNQEEISEKIDLERDLIHTTF